MLLDGCWCLVPLPMLAFEKLSGRQTIKIRRFVPGSIEVWSLQADWNSLLWNLVNFIALVPDIEPDIYIHIYIKNTHTHIYIYI